MLRWKQRKRINFVTLPTPVRSPTGKDRSAEVFAQLVRRATASALARIDALADALTDLPPRRFASWRGRRMSSLGSCQRRVGAVSNFSADWLVE